MSRAAELIPYVSYVLDTALSPDHNIQDIGVGTYLVGWQCGFEPLVVAVIASYTEAIDGSDAEEIAADYLEEKKWFSGERTEADFVVKVTKSTEGATKRAVNDRLSREGEGKFGRNPNTSRSRQHETVTIKVVLDAFGLGDPDDLIERNHEFIWEMSKVEADNLTEEEIAEKTIKAEQQVQDSIYKAWQRSVERVLDQVADDVGVRLAPQWNNGTMKVTAEVDWPTAARKLRDTIHGVGYFEIPSEDLRAPKKFVLEHWKHARDYPDVYGRESYARLFEKDLEGNLRNL